MKPTCYTIFAVAVLQTALVTFLMIPVLMAQDPSSVAGGGSGIPSGTSGAAGKESAGGESAKPVADPSKFLGKDTPFLDPGSDTMTWDGKIWNLNNNRFFRARFEEYLNAKEQTEKEDLEYQKIIQEIMDLLSPSQVSAPNVDKAWGLLPKASNYRIDANLCDALASAVYSVWMARNEQGRIVRANDVLKREQELVSWNARAEMSLDPLKRPPSSGKSAAAKALAEEWQKAEQIKRDLTVGASLKRLAEIEAMTAANKLKREASELLTKVNFQTLIVQFFLQRRFQHVAIGTRMCQGIFTDGDTRLHLEGEAKNLFSQTTGMPPTLSVLDTLANEAMRDVEEGVEAYRYLLEKGEMAGATERLSEAFALGEYLPAIRKLPREDKRKALEFARKGNQMLSAIEVKDYERAENLVKELEAAASDFDSAKPMAAIGTAKALSQMLLDKARNASIGGDRVTLEKTLKEAAEVWPRNPDLAKMSSAIFERSDIQQKALADLDQLISQRNYRQIYEDRVRYIAAAALSPERGEKLRKILTDMTEIEGALIRAREIAKRGDFAGAWESVERVFEKFPDDTQLNQVRADLTTEAASFIRTLRTAERLEETGQTGSSLAWFLKAQSLYPASEYAQKGILRTVEEMLPGTGGRLSASADDNADDN